MPSLLLYALADLQFVLVSNYILIGPTSSVLRISIIYFLNDTSETLILDL